MTSASPTHLTRSLDAALATAAATLAFARTIEAALEFAAAPKVPSCLWRPAFAF
jgi:hypothetical protein